MPLSYDDYNTFSRELATRFALRAKGIDASSDRLVNISPSDHVLAGFLTPASMQSGFAQYTPESVLDERADLGPSDSIEASLVEDLPQDSAYEQTALGMYWLVPLSALRTGSHLHATIQFHVYLRRLPTRMEQTENAILRLDRDPHTSYNQAFRPLSGIAATNDMNGYSSNPKAPNAGRNRFSDVVKVWTRENIPPIALPPIDLGAISAKRRMTINLGEQTQAAIAACSNIGIFPGRHSIQVPEEVLKSDDSYNHWLENLPVGTVQNIWNPVLDVRLVPVPTDSTCARIAVRLINRSHFLGQPALAFLDPNLYAAKISIAIPSDAHRPTIFRELPNSFRYDRTMPGVGINTHVTIKQEDKQIILETDSTPVTFIERLEPREIPNGIPYFAQLERDPIPLLHCILDGMRKYDSEQWEQLISTLDGNDLQEANQARATFQTEIARFERGIELLENKKYEHVMRSFILMNKSMQQAAGGRYDKWRLFQIVFIISQLPGLAGREYEELRQDDDGDIDILWFAAGGGKTEAFLGLILWQAFFDRLRGKKIGVAAFVRFPLRLLTFQQLQRLSTALGAAELIRRENRLGGAKFSMGYFVGRATTPNKIDDETHRRYVLSGLDARLLRVYNCPFCNAPTKLGYDQANRIVEHRCSDINCKGGNERLPIYVIDEDIYRFLPTVIISTVDKLAQFGQNQRFSQLFGRFDLVCPVHGASFLDTNRSCSAAVAFSKGERPTTCAESKTPVNYGPFKDPAPSLLIQDELHLLSEELGTFDSHYETATMELARSFMALPWKIIAATATIEKYAVHAWQLYLRRARQFPGPGPQAFESFYYNRNQNQIGRIFIGILGVGRKHTPIVTKSLSLMYLELQAARDRAATDVTEATRYYGLGPLTKEEFAELIFYYELLLTYVLTRKGSDQIAEAIESRVKNELRDMAPQHGDLLIDTFNGGVTEAEMSSVVQQIRAADPSADPASRTRGIITTNVIGHGVDVDRFNVIVFAGFPRMVAEYIQASARVGRKYPGISIFIATPQSERDRSVFDRFAKFHEYLDRLVDPSAIIRWPEPALRRTVPGILCGYLMGVAAASINQRVWAVENVQDFHGRAGAEALDYREIVAWMEKAYGVQFAPSPRYRDQLALAVQNQYSSIVNRPRNSGGRFNSLNIHLAAMQSLRDTDDPAYIRVGQEQDVAILRRILHG